MTYTEVREVQLDRMKRLRESYKRQGFTVAAAQMQRAIDHSQQPAQADKGETE